MGYCMSLMDEAFRIPANRKAEALAAIKALANDTQAMNGGEYSGGKYGGQKVNAWYSWVDTDEFANASTLKEAMQAWRWEIIQVPDNSPVEAQADDVIGISFNGEKLGQDDVMLRAIAPFVEDGSYIQMQGEDGEIWRWVFRDGQLKEIQANIAWNDEPNCEPSPCEDTCIERPRRKYIGD